MATIKKCKSCQVDIDAKADKCPNCGTSQRSWFALHPIIASVLALIILGVIGMIIGGGINSGSSGQVQTYSGGGGGNSFIQEHMGRALQHLGL